MSTNNEWKALLLLAQSKAAEQGVTGSQFYDQATTFQDTGKVDANNYEIDEWGRMTYVQAMIELDPRYEYIAFHSLVPFTDGLNLTDQQIGNILMNCQVTRNGTSTPGFMTGFDDLKDMVSWKASLRREPPKDGGFGPWTSLGTFGEPTIPTRFRTIAEMVSYFAEHPAEQLKQFKK